MVTKNHDETMSCTHVFTGGLCEQCLCPETPGDTQRALNAVDNAAALRNHWSDVLQKYVDEAEAIRQAHRSHRR